MKITNLILRNLNLEKKKNLVNVNVVQNLKCFKI